ncbi:MAG: amidohydrolase [Kordiimonadaceae bacterium]|nr:amidohydrolase [Kordiimonadaceae bacterium]
MKNSIVFLLIAVAVIYVTFFYRQADGVDPVTANMVINNTTIYTANDDQWTAQAVAVKDDKIIFVGSNADAEAYIDENTNVIDMTGNTVYPGLTDAHAHIDWIGDRELGLNLQGIEDLDETVAKIRERVEATPEGEWVLGVGWIENKWSDQRFLNKDDLDPFSPNTPVIAKRAGEHSIVANSKAMELAGITRDTPDPDGGQILKDENGDPTGMFVDNAMDLIRDHVPEPTREQNKTTIKAGFDFMARMGWTQVQQAGGSLAQFDIIKELHAENNLKTRLYFAVWNYDAEKLLARGPEISPDRMVDLKGIKYQADGGLGSRGAALLDHYDDADSKGLQLIDHDQALPILKEALRKGIQMEIHAIGDYTNRFVLDLYEEAFNAVPVSEWVDPDPRWRIEHAQIIHSDDQKRYKELDIIAVVEASTVKGDLYFARDRIGSDRLKNAYLWKSLIDQGIRFSAGTDAPVEKGDPREEFFSLVQRTDFNGFYTDDWHIEEKLSHVQALKTMTLWAAHAAFQEDIRGTIEVGKKADFSIFNKDWMTIEPIKIMDSETVMTIVDGKVTYER